MWCRCDARIFAAAAQDRHLKRCVRDQGFGCVFNRALNRSLSACPNGSLIGHSNGRLNERLSRRLNGAPIMPLVSRARSLRAA